MNKNLKSIFGSVTGLDEKSIQFLTNALEKNNLPGFDYIEFKQSISNLSGMQMDEATSFKSAFATASTMGLTKEKLVQTAAHYRAVILKEQNQFEIALKNQTDQKVESKRTEVEKLKAEIDVLKQEITDREQKIAAHQQTLESADGQIAAAVEKISQTRSAFELTLQSILNQIDKDIQNINSYI